MLITRRFTPPTCTLEIEANSSVLSRWTKHKAIKTIYFQLSFDDPRLTEEQQVTIKGDRTQLEQLYQAVSNYIQNFLQQSSLEEIVSSSQPSTLVATTQPYLKPQGLVAHDLFLGSLGDNKSGDKIQLDTVQLFDLVTALEDYQVEIAAILNLNSSNWRKFPLWGTAVASIVLVVGLVTLGFNLFNRTSTNLQSASSLQESAPNKPSVNQNEVIPPQVKKSPKPPETERQLQDPLSSEEKLPPPPPVDLPKPPPANVPDFSKYPLPKPNIEPSIAKKTPSKPSPLPSEPELTLNSKREDILIPDVPPLSTSLLPTEEEIINDSVANINQADKEDSLEQEQSFQSLESEESDLTPQLKEVEKYFQQQWQPPAELKQTLEYRLVIGSDGSIARITPIGKASAIFIDRTNIPLMGESFVSPSSNKANQTIRLLLSPDGEVKTFLESK